MADDAIQSFLSTYDQNDLSDSPDRRAVAACCCGNASCAYLKHNQDALEGLERHVCTAAQLGKALLVRHEAYIADSEQERAAMTAQIEVLEAEKQILERKNATIIEENRSLLDQLESLNSALTESDAQVTGLQSVLQSAQHELQRLSHLAARTERLEQQLADFEREQATWHTSLQLKEESEKSAVRRWQEAERTLTTIQDQIDRIENEAKEEKERHLDVVRRMERRHAVERELDTAAGRLKGAAALKTSSHDSSGSNVVSHFVKDILQDNANLQMGIVELREMLQGSNQEVENLRNQLSLHQPVGDEDDSVSEVIPARPHLKDEMRRATTQALHVHHHYHAPSSAPKPNQIRRPKKRRYAGYVQPQPTSLSGTSTPRSSFSYGMTSSAATILQQTAASLPDNVTMDNHWLMQPTSAYETAFSGPSSPRSSNRESSVFDRVFSDGGQESSRATTPEVEDPGSPPFHGLVAKRSSGSPYHSLARQSSHRNRPSLDSILDMSVENLRQLDLQHGKQAAIPEEDEAGWEQASSIGPDEESNGISPTSYAPVRHREPRMLRRAASHESLLSVSGMDVHTLKSRPSQLLTPYGGRSLTTGAIVSDATAHATLPLAAPGRSNSGHSLLSDMANEHGVAGAARAGLYRRVGGWVWGKWGVSPMPNKPAPPSIAKRPSAPSIASASTGDESQTTPKPVVIRPPGINQRGPILGFGPEIKIQHPPIMATLDQDALNRVLEET